MSIIYLHILKISTHRNLCIIKRKNSNFTVEKYGRHEFNQVVDIISIGTNWYSASSAMRQWEDHSPTSGVFLTKMNKAYSMMRKHEANSNWETF